MRVLLLGYETEAYSMGYLGELLTEDDHRVRLALCDYYNFIDDTSIHDYLESRDISDWVNYADQYQRLYEDNWSVDWEFLQSFEEEYTDSKNLQQLLMSDPILSRENHFRVPYYTSIESRDHVYYWAELLIRWTMDILSDFEPDLVLTYGRNYFIKNVVAQVSLTSDLPMLALIPSRIGDYCHISREFSLGTDEHIAALLEDDESWEDTSEAQSHIDSFAESTDGLYDATAQDLSRGESLYAVSEIAGQLLDRYIHTAKHVLQGSKTKYRGKVFARNYFNSHRPSVVRWRTRSAFNRLRYELTDPFEREPPERSFIYVPLHTLPESSTLTLSTEYYERDLVRFMSKEVPAGIDIAVKENPNMVGPRPFDYYDDLERLPNVHLVDPTVESIRLIRESRGVCGISGTALFEAAILDTPTHYFGCPEFEHVLDYEGHEEFPTFANACKEGDESKHPDRVRRYIQYVFDRGRELEFQEMRSNPESDTWRHATQTAHSMFNEEMETIDV